ncbi:MAG: GNAT family N-acetyltransferase [Clostridia bacterium]|nr:GNAT family N-acetyltransferase [Clostridia bacterium]
MWDSSVKVMGLAMKAGSLPELPEITVPEPYGWRFYQPGDEKHWADMWVSAGAFRTVEDALRTFANDFPDKDALTGRMIFLTDGGVPFATATAWFGETQDEGRLHWVCIDEAHQGQGLSKILIALALRLCGRLGYKSACLLTQTPCWVAIRMYRRFGFAPQIRSDADREGWQIVSEKSGVGFLNH